MHDNEPEQWRSIWQSQISESHSFTVEELRSAAKQLRRRIYWRNLREFIAVAIVVFAMARNIVLFHNLLSRLGSALIVAGALIVAYQLWKNGSARQTDGVFDVRSCAESYRSELERQRDLLRSVWKWYILPLVPGVIVFFVGTLRLALARQKAHPPYQLITGFAGFIVICIVAHMLNRRAARKLQRKIDELNELRGN